MNLPIRLLVLPFVLLLASAAVAGVRIVGQAPSDDATIQLAVDVADEGDVVLVRPGTYAPFTIDDKSLTVAALRPGTVTIQGTVEVKNLAASRTVVLADLSATGANAVSYSSTPPGLRLTNSPGALRVHGSTFTGGKGMNVPFSFGPGGHGVAVSGCLDVAITSSTLRGGVGGGSATTCEECWGGVGGDGLNTATSAVALYDCTLEGGRGGIGGNSGGWGGNGAKIPSWGLFASRSSFRGGTGGDNWDYLTSGTGHGGDGLVVAAGAGAKLLDSAFLPGTGGYCYICNPQYAPSGQTTSGAGLFQYIPGMARRFATRALAGAPGSLAIEVDGTPGDRVYITGGPPAFRFKWGWHGVWLVRFPAPISTEPLGILDSSGSGVFALPMSALPAGTGHALGFLQGVVINTQGQAFISSPLTVTLLDCATLQPDCDGDGTFDGCEIAFASIVDADANGVEDACDPDCNANGVLDSIDVSAQTSADLNANLVPDECEPAVATWYVDPTAPADGDGSIASPFRNLAQASYAALGGHTIVLFDGLYTGSSNRGFVFNGRNLTVRSADGPSGCVIDLENAGRAFLIADGETAAARVEGLTIKRGGAPGAPALDAGAAIRVSGASPTIVACVFEQNTAVNGGAVSLANSDTLVRGCSFRANAASMYVGRGGALSVSNGRPRIVDCTFAENSAESGGALSLLGTSGLGLVISHCVFHKNSVARYGGAAFVSFDTAAFEHCLFTENRGNASNSQGGAIFLSNQALAGFSSCTIARNTTTLQGSGVYVSPAAAATLRDSIVWGNTGPSPQVALFGSGSQTASLAVAYCDVEGGAAAVYQSGSTQLSWGAGNLDVDPAFVDPDGGDDDPATLADNDWRLWLASPCIDAGDNALVAIDWADIDGDADTSELVPLDLDLAQRFVDVASVPDTGNGTAPIVDMGCYERP